MKSVLILSIALLFGVASAHGKTYRVQMVYRDMIRPHGRARSNATYEADADACYSQTGDLRGLADTAAFKACMLGRGWRYQTTRFPDGVPPPAPDP